MKNIILSLVILAFTASTSFATNVIPESELSIISVEKIELSVVNISQKDFFQVAQYNSEMDALDFVTKDKVNYIQIYSSEGKLQYQLPVMSNKLKVSRKMFEKGAYKIAFITKNNTTIQFTNLQIN